MPKTIRQCAFVIILECVGQNRLLSPEDLLMMRFDRFTERAQEAAQRAASSRAVSCSRVTGFRGSKARPLQRRARTSLIGTWVWASLVAMVFSNSLGCRRRLQRFRLKKITPVKRLFTVALDFTDSTKCERPGLYQRSLI